MRIALLIKIVNPGEIPARNFGDDPESMLATGER
jgi:hypothetical protein